MTDLPPVQPQSPKTSPTAGPLPSRRALLYGGACLGSSLLLPGCTSYRTRQSRRPRGANADLLLPVVAVAEFENRASFQGQWSLGSGFADLLVAELLQTGDFVVLDRKHLGDVIRELNMQHNDAFRKEGRATPGRLKNARYLIRGTITDFTVVGDVSGWFGKTSRKKSAAVGGGGKSARVAVVLKVVDVESGEILTTVETYGRAGSGWFSSAVNYTGLSFGGQAFFRTPLGDATSEALKKAAQRLESVLPRKAWEPRVAAVEADGRVLINGGTNVGVKAGQRFRVTAKGRVHTDPVTGNIVHQEAGPTVGEIVVESVLPQAAWARIHRGTAQRGQVLVSQ